jgi:hypothetical protein
MCFLPIHAGVDNEMDDSELYESDSDQDIIANKRNAPRLRLGLDIGYGYRVAEIPANAEGAAKDYFNNLKKGMVLAANFSYILGKQYGIALQLSNFSTAPSVPASYTDVSGNTEYGKLESDVSIKYLGIGLAEWKFNKNKTAALYGNFTLGYITFTDDATIVDKPYKQEGNSIGFGAQIGGDFMLSETIYLGVNIGYIVGSISNLQLNGEAIPSDIKESVNRFDFNIGLRYVN